MYHKLEIAAGDKLVTTTQAADLLCVSARTLEAWRLRGSGPRFIRYSQRCVRYRISDLQAWQHQREYQNTSQYNAYRKL